jgi:hypothetical protein
VHLAGAVAQLTGKHDHFTNDQLGNTARVAEGGVEDGNTLVGGILEVDLVGTDTEATDDDKVLRFLQDSCGELRLRANTNDVDIPAIQHSQFMSSVSHREGIRLGPTESSQ